jgi:MFS family permease
MFGWMKDLDTTERKTLIATFSGWAVDGLDVMVYTYAIPTLLATWHMSKTQAGLIVTSSVVLSAVGGWLAGILADRYGRVRVLQIAILWFAFFTFLCGFTDSFGQLLVARGLQGLGYGGEWAVGSVLIGEMIRAEHRGKAVGTVQSGWAIGWGAANLVYVTCYALLPETLAWRALFWVGILPSLLVLWIRRNVREPDIAVATRAKSRETGVSFLDIFAPDLLRTTVLASLMTTGMMIGYYAVFAWLPTFLKTERHLSVLGSGWYTMVVIVGSFLGFLTAAHLSDRWGRRATFVTFAAASALIAVIYTTAPITNELMLVLGFPLGFFLSGNFSGCGPFFTELYPSRVRGSGQGFSYNFGRGLSAFGPPLIGELSGSMGLGSAIGLLAGCGFALVVVVVFLLPETRGKLLAVYD